MTDVNSVPVRFVTVSTQRSGSTWLTDLLNSHPDIASYTELLLLKGDGMPDWGIYKDMVYWQTWRRQLCGGKKYIRPLGLFRYLDEAFARYPDMRATGMKLMYTQIAKFPETLWYLRNRDVRVIHLVRRNVLDVVLSGLAKNARKVAHAKEGVEVEQVRIRVEPGLLLRQMERRQREQRWFAWLLGRLSVPFLQLVYEDIVDDQSRLNECLGFLGCPCVTLGSRMTKLNPGCHADLVENIDDVSTALQGTPFAVMLRVQDY